MHGQYLISSNYLKKCIHIYGLIIIIIIITQSRYLFSQTNGKKNIDIIILV